MLEVRLLGQFDVRLDGQPVEIPSRPAQSLLAYLLLSAGTAHRREKLAGLLWPDAPESNARNSLRQALWRIRNAIETRQPKEHAFLLTDEFSIALDAAADYWLDAAILEGKVAETASAAEWMDVVSVYQGELLPGFYDEWVVLERERLQGVFERKIQRLLERLVEEQRWHEVLEWGERWIALGHVPEPAYRALMMAHGSLGDVSSVAAVYNRCVEALRNDLGVELSEQTRTLYQRLSKGEAIPGTVPVRMDQLFVQLSAPEAPFVSEQAAPRGIATPSPSHVPPVRTANLPIPLTSFIGREHEIAVVNQLLSAGRLVTLTGAGGSGKTRLAIQVATELLSRFNDGVWWVELAALTDQSLVPQAVAKALGVREVPTQSLSETLVNNLHSKHLLLVLDNCEHLIEACARLAEQLLSACTHLKILATSREALGLMGETVYQVPTLSLPDAQHSSVQQVLECEGTRLFIERARAVKSDFGLIEQNASHVVQICRRLDGIPLAIELAAARAKVLSAEEIAKRLDDRFNLLTSGSRTAMLRQQTLRAAIDWSHDLLTEPERILFRGLAVFVGGFTLEAAEAVCGQGELKRSELLNLLGRLVDKSLVIVEQDSTTGETRYHLLETIRQYALEKLVGIGQAAAIRDHHLEFYLSLSEKSEPNIFGRESVIWFNRLDNELDNIRAAIEWSTNSGKAVAALRMAGSLVHFWFVHGPLLSEWQDRIQRALSRPEGMARTLARAKALNGIGFLYSTDMDPMDRRPELEEALSIGRELGDQWNIATALRNLGRLANLQGNQLEARSLLEQSLEIWRVMGPEDKMGRSRTLTILGDVALNQDEVERARSLHEESVAILREIGDMNFLAYSVRRLGLLAWREGDYKKAATLCRESLILNQETGDRRGVIACVAGFAAIAAAQGKLERAARLMAAAETQLASIGIRLLHWDKMEYERNFALLRAQLDEATLEAASAEGQAMTLEQAIAHAFEEPMR